MDRAPTAAKAEAETVILKTRQGGRGSESCRRSRADKIRYFGVSNLRGWCIAQILSLCRELNVPQPVVCQPYINLLNRMLEVEILPACHHFGIGVVPYRSIARSVFTGKYLPGLAPEHGSRGARQDRRIMETEFREESLIIAQRLKVRADERGVQLGRYATAWALRNPGVTEVIAAPHIGTVAGLFRRRQSGVDD